MLFRYQEYMEESFPFKIQVKTSSSGLSSRQHAHDYVQICYVRKGSCLHRMNDKQTAIVKGDLFSIPPLCEHALKEIDGQESEIVHIDFMPQLLNGQMSGLTRIGHFVDFAFFQPYVQLNDSLLPKLNLSYDAQVRVEALIAEMEAEFAGQQEGYELVIAADLQRLLVIAGREFAKYSRHEREHQMVSAHRRHFEQTLAWMDENYMHPLKLKDVAAKTAMSPAYFSTVFKLLKGTTFIDYVNELRVSQAMRLLKETDWSVEVIAEQTGFNHLTHFYRMFRRITGVTPNEFRKQNNRSPR